jgi:hypothetical protein
VATGLEVLLAKVPGAVAGLGKEFGAHLGLDVFSNSLQEAVKKGFPRYGEKLADIEAKRYEDLAKILDSLRPFTPLVYLGLLKNAGEEGRLNSEAIAESLMFRKRQLKKPYTRSQYFSVGGRRMQGRPSAMKRWDRYYDEVAEDEANTALSLPLAVCIRDHKEVLRKEEGKAFTLGLYLTFANDMGALWRRDPASYDDTMSYFVNTTRSNQVRRAARIAEERTEEIGNAALAFILEAS